MQPSDRQGIREAHATFESSTDEIDRALAAMELIAPLCGNESAQKRYQLPHIVIQTPASRLLSGEKQEASRLIVYDAYR